MQSYTISTSGEVKVVRPANGEDFSLEELQGFVGGYIELVSLSQQRVMVLNEEGKLMKLPQNGTATALARKVLGAGDHIVGDVLICSRELVK